MERLDLVVFGATGFTGRCAVEEVHRISKDAKNITWGIAGRSLPKLEKIIGDLEKQTGDDLSKVKTIIADVCDEDSLKKMAEQAKVVINCCGPYRFYGENLVKACIEGKASQVDVSGEPAYMERMQLKYNEAAETAGVYIVSACGYDSIPADMGVVFLQQNFKGTVNSVECHMRSHIPSEHISFGEPSINYGTWESLVYGITEQSELAPIRRQLFPTPVLSKLTPRQEQRRIVHQYEEDGAWYIPFLGADRSVVTRSQLFFHKTEQKRPAQMRAYIGFPSLTSVMILILYGVFLFVMTKFSFTRKILLKHPRICSFGFISREGPSKKVMDNTRFWHLIKGTGWDESEKDIEFKEPLKTMTVKVAGVNPGYGATCTSLVCSAITILKEADKMPGSGGVLPPGAAFAKTSLIENLCKNNVTFEVLDDNAENSPTNKL